MADAESPPAEATSRVERRRAFHVYPEPSWCEFLTTSRLVDCVEAIGVDELYVGRDVIAPEHRLGVPDADVRERWRERAAEHGARPDVLDATTGGTTGLVAVLEKGPGPVVGLRVDIDALPVEEATGDDHDPAREGFRSQNDGVMHACGHDAHMTIGLGVLAELASSEFSGTFKLFFQPAEEVLGGGRPMVESGHADDLDAFFALHVGFGHPTGTVVSGVEKPLAIRQTRATFTGDSAHAGSAPQAGRNAMQAMATAIQNVYGVSRHADALTRVNVGRAEAGTASNVVAERATIDLEARAGTNDVLAYLTDRVDRVLETAAEMHDCDLATTTIGEAPRVDSDDALADVVGAVARGHADVEAVRPSAALGASEDATYFMRRVRQTGGRATYVVVGTDHPGGHHTPTFDIDEASLDVGVDVLSEAIRRTLAGDANC
ncbi:amidohydrolase (plasmid) [Halarchaeum sp. CBA1220]|uniref:amidohydrolase n=1 Tax=Halarchaeum sp. CBA1220 TaxID=1853682 RepID=UPI000F3A9410|nr:amidohydrolase [Halarchaeum sp. CBA1220]QLC35367.1 amidohydrolase [Halarchaeum sp. CBA1220]